MYKEKLKKVKKSKYFFELLNDLHLNILSNYYPLMIDYKYIL